MVNLFKFHLVVCLTLLKLRLILLKAPLRLFLKSHMFNGSLLISLLIILLAQHMLSINTALQLFNFGLVRAIIAA